MAKDKDRALNPAAAHRKQEKQKALKKGKAAVAASRTARFATRNPSRLERQITELKSLQESSGSLNTRDKKQLEELERDVARIRKAKLERPDLLRQKDDDGTRAGRGSGVLGKRDRDGRPLWTHDQSSNEETDEEVRKIPMPRDTPPPIPRPRHPHSHNANMEPLGAGRELLQDVPPQTLDLALPSKPVSAVQKVYESAPQVRDLRKEATERFMPSVVKRKLDASKGKGRLLEDEEVEQLEKEGYGSAFPRVRTCDGEHIATRQQVIEVNAAPAVREPKGAQVGQDLGEEQRRRLEEEEERFTQEMAMAEEVGGLFLAGEAGIDRFDDGYIDRPGRRVMLEEVEDEDL